LLLKLLFPLLKARQLFFGQLPQLGLELLLEHGTGRREFVRNLLVLAIARDDLLQVRVGLRDLLPLHRVLQHRRAPQAPLELHKLPFQLRQLIEHKPPPASHPPPAPHPAPALAPRPRWPPQAGPARAGASSAAASTGPAWQSSALRATRRPGRRGG